MSDNFNLLYNKDFRLEILRLPMVNYFISSADIPGITTTAAIYPTPFTDIKVPGDKIQFSPLTITFNVDEDLRNWEELFSWMNQYGTPDNFKQYMGDKSNASPKQATANHLSQATLFTSTNKDNPNIRIIFEQLFPIDLSTIPLNLKVSSTDPIVCTATFAYTKFRIER